MKRATNHTGFTIIEVVLVLAIAGLIFLMVFVALPALQRSQRDTQRRNDYAVLSSAMLNYITNHNGSLPAGGTVLSKENAADAQQYIGGSGLDPDGKAYCIKVYSYTGYSKLKNGTSTGCDASGNFKKTPRAGQVYVITNSYCTNDGTIGEYEGNSNFSVYGYLESGTYCQSNTDGNPDGNPDGS